jgi:hypothetical protein
MSRNDSVLRDRVIFIVGARRSGTNWLERILTAHPEVVAMPTETYLFSHGVQPLSERFQHANPESPEIGRTFLPREAFLDVARDLVDRAMLETLARSEPGARYVVERTPWHASHLPLIADVVPDAHVVSIVRDGRAVARSLVSMPWGPDSIAEAAAEWRGAVTDAKAGGAAFGARFREVLYEDLAREPRRVAGEIFAWLGLQLDDQTWERILGEAGAEFNVDPGSPGIGTDKWRSQMSAADLQTVERVAGSVLQSYGYALAAPSGGRPPRESPRLRAIRRPRTALGQVRAAAATARARSFARLAHADQIAHNQAVADFERLVAVGDRAAARALLAPRLWTRIDAGEGARQDRGERAADELLATLADHQERGPQVLSGHVHATPYGLTTTSTYRLPDGSRWVRVLVYTARGGRLTNIGLYRHQLADEPPR